MKHCDRVKYSMLTSWLLLVTIFFSACHRPAISEQQTIPADSMMMHMLRAVFDTNVSCLVYQDEFMMFMDTLKTQVETYPDEDIRIGAKSFAMNLFGLFFYGDFTTPEENRFFTDSLILPLADIQHTWYIPPYVLSKEIADYYREPVLAQTIVHSYNDENHVIYMDLYFFPNGKELMFITLPKEAAYLASVMFHGESMDAMDSSATYDLQNAFNLGEEDEYEGQLIIYADDFIEAMLSHEGMYIAYIGDEETEAIKDRWHDAHLDLAPFHRQYQQVKQLVKEANDAAL